MNHRKRPHVAATIFALLLGGCAATPEQPAAEAEAAAPAMTGSANPVAKDVGTMVAAAFGKGTYELADGTPVGFAFDAYLHQDDSVGGFMQLNANLPGGAIEFEGNVTCFTKDSPNNVAWIGGTVTRNGSVNPGFLRQENMAGEDFWFRVRGAGGDPAIGTRVSAMGFSGDDGVRSAAQYCKKRFWADNDEGTFRVVTGTLGIFP